MGNEKIRIAVLDDYQNVAKGCADWAGRMLIFILTILRARAICLPGSNPMT
jgi:hypothetical protein